MSNYNNTSYHNSHLLARSDSNSHLTSSLDELPEDIRSVDDPASIYGGVAGSAPSDFRIAVPQKANDEITTRWSPSVHSLLDQPPATFPQRLIIGGLAFCMLVGSWVWLGSIEEVGHAQGKLVPKGATYKIQPLELGKVSYVAIKEGDEVKAGQILVEFDTELAQKEVERLQQMLIGYQLEQTQKQALLEKIQLEAQTHSAIAAAEAQGQYSVIELAKEKAATSRQLLLQQQAELSAYQTRKASLQPLLLKVKEHNQQLQNEELARKEQIARLKPLAREGAISQEYVFQAEQALRETQQRITQNQLQEVTSTHEQLFQADQSLRSLEAQITQNQGNLATAFKEAEQLQAELLQKQAQAKQIQLESLQRQQQLAVEMTQLKAKVKETENLLASAQAKLKNRYLKAPVSGVVLSLEDINPGEVIDAGKIVAEVAPNNVPLVLSAVLPNREAGFVKLGMPVQIKLDAYPYQDYGIVAGTVTKVSEDTKPDEKLGQVYRVEVQLEADHITEKHQQVRFKAGQTATADIITRRQRIIDVVLEPIRKIQNDGIKL
ncbi:secretion protein HlyD [Aphanothece hegewaldii CCALA 016]|uniref:Secretion protein HlyD n=1 Tax=Aphanothece hegewaldii CCALA 016 TaxID=2107694 RepID=A0A2T1LRL6_9CHRO|nr:HlyD family efflux transporter periplasmic adaptor subunit [Aphanothece hegewaldii]PSF31391.1 secretion protein HlyD [Aphanothece hegewaldii CCALA 016]